MEISRNPSNQPGRRLSPVATQEEFCRSSLIFDRFEEYAEYNEIDAGVTFMATGRPISHDSTDVEYRYEVELSPQEIVAALSVIPPSLIQRAVLNHLQSIESFDWDNYEEWSAKEQTMRGFGPPSHLASAAQAVIGGVVSFLENKSTA